MSEWIKCSDRLPRLSERIGYVYDGKNIRTDVYFPGFNGRWESENTLGYSIDENSITHWMKLPNPPSAE